MILTITGAPCSGKSTVARMLELKYGFDRMSTGKIVRDMAKERGLDIVQMQEVLNADPTIDQKIEERQKQIGIERADDKLIMEARLAWYAVPHSFKVYVTIPEDEMAKRFLADSERENNNDKPVSSVEEAREVLAYRKTQEIERYKKIYGVDLSDMSNFDFVAENYNKTPEQTADEIYEAYKKYVKKNKHKR
ncbi:MAG: AAA family ATPase [Clostridia bacterium]|nr:AAA family ATPase [Clostridia bacterium]